MTEQTPTSTAVAAAEPVLRRLLGAASLAILVALAVTGDLDRRWPATGGVLALWVMSVGIVVWCGRHTDRAETRATKVAAAAAICSAVGSFVLALWAHSERWDVMIRMSQLCAGCYPI